jgi:hypothetical protein
LTKLFSRKLFAAVIAFITLQVMPNLPASTQAKWQAFVAAAYLIAQGVADAFGSNKEGPSQGAV